MKRWKLLLAGAALSILVPAVPAPCGSLEKFQLPPVQQQAPSSYRMKSAPEIEPVPDLPVYRNFRTYVEEQPTEQIDRMIETYSSRKLQAFRDKDWSKASYYGNLINILLSERRTR